MLLERRRGWLCKQDDGVQMMLSPKEQLMQIPQINQRITQRVKLIEHYMEQAEKMGGALKQICVKSGGTQSPMTDWVDKAIDLAGDIEREVEELRAERRLVCGIVAQITNPRHKQVLELRYFSPYPPTWEYIAEEMGLDVRWVYRLHGEALAEYGKIASPAVFASKSHCQA
jgi:hypothetical protein